MVMGFRPEWLASLPVGKELPDAQNLPGPPPSLVFLVFLVSLGLLRIPWDPIQHMIFIHGHVSDLQRFRFAPKDREPKRRIQLLGGGLVIAHGEDDLFQASECSGSLQHFLH
jgi:hypothetical protein